jgi:Arc/MetJ-type ribon-helix-helix transcriptional regulator
MRMVVTLTREQESALSALVAAGDYPSIEVAARTLLDERLSEREIEELAPEALRAHIAEAEADVEAGRLMSLEDHRASVEALLKSLS